MVSRTLPRAGWFLNKANHVPYYQRLYQANNGIRLWRKGPKSRYYLRPYYVLLYGTTGASLYGIGRVILGHRTWFSDA